MNVAVNGMSFPPTHFQKNCGGVLQNNDVVVHLAFWKPKYQQELATLPHPKQTESTDIFTTYRFKIRFNIIVLSTYTFLRRRVPGLSHWISHLLSVD
jgi:hypothetical protein